LPPGWLPRDYGGMHEERGMNERVSRLYYPEPPTRDKEPVKIPRTGQKMASADEKRIDSRRFCAGIAK
jgi:hypothetical protein